MSHTYPRPPPHIFLTGFGQIDLEENWGDVSSPVLSVAPPLYTIYVMSFKIYS
jgi:hypothetical protein